MLKQYSYIIKNITLQLVNNFFQNNRSFSRLFSSIWLIMQMHVCGSPRYNMSKYQIFLVFGVILYNVYTVYWTKKYFVYFLICYLLDFCLKKDLFFGFGPKYFFYFFICPFCTKGNRKRTVNAYKSKSTHPVQYCKTVYNCRIETVLHIVKCKSILAITLGEKLPTGLITNINLIFHCKQD